MTALEASQVNQPLDMRRSGSFLRWDDIPHFEPGFFVGSEGDNGEHLRDTSGWPFSVYRMTREIGGCDVVICHGIQSLGDAQEICERLQGLA